LKHMTKSPAFTFPKSLRRVCAGLLLSGLLLPILPFTSAQAQPASTSHQALEYKTISGFKQPFNDDLQLQLSKGWTPVGGIAVTVWNNDLYFAVLLSRPAAQ
jgi:hypothetical protein